MPKIHVDASEEVVRYVSDSLLHAGVDFCLVDNTFDLLYIPPLHRVRLGPQPTRKCEECNEDVIA